MANHPLAPYISYNPLTINESTPLYDLVQMLDEYGFHHWPVVNGDRQLVGMVSHQDILRTLQDEAASHVAFAIERRASDVMSRRLVTVEHHEPVRAALRRMISNHIHSLPVLEEQRLIGMVTSTDFLREFSYGELAISHEVVTEFMSTVAEPIEVTATLDEAMQAMQEAGSETVAVVQHGCALGVLTRRQVRTVQCRQAVLVANVATSHDDAYALTPVAQLVSDAPVLRPGQRMHEAAALMLEHRLHALAVVNQANRLLGIISEEDILRAVQEH